MYATNHSNNYKWYFGVMFNSYSVHTTWNYRIKDKFSILYSQSFSQGNWLTVSLISSRIHLIFRSLLGSLDLPARSAPLADEQWHTVSIVRVESR